MRVPGLDDLDEVYFKILTDQESKTRDGQEAKLFMIENMIAQRLDRRRDYLRTHLTQDFPDDLDALEIAVYEVAPDVVFKRVAVKTGGYNLIVEKHGKPADKRERNYNVMIPAHVDVVQANQPAYKIDGDARKGAGVWDMGAAILNGIYLAAEAQVPRGMSLYFAFTVDEEGNSDGAKTLVDTDQWPEFGKIDAIVSNEIGAEGILPNGTIVKSTPKKSDKSMQFHSARQGHLKYRVEMDVDEEHQGHASRQGVTNIDPEYTELCSYMKSRMNGPVGRIGSRKPQILRTHKKMGSERYLEMGGGPVKKPMLVLPHFATRDYSIFSVEGASRKKRLEEQRKVVAELAKIQEWTKKGVTCTVNERPGEESYSGFNVPNDNPVVQIVADILKKVSGVAALNTTATSVADEDVYAEAMLEHLPGNSFKGTDKAVISIPIIGDHAHNRWETMSWSDAGRVRFAMQLLIEDPEGFRKLLKNQSK